MERRNFLLLAPAAVSKVWRDPPLSPALKAEQQRLETLRPAPEPAIAMNHLGFLPEGRKTIIYRLTGGPAPVEFTLRDTGGPSQPFQLTLPLKRVASDLGDCLVGDFSHLQREAMYQVTVGGERSVPFFIRPDLWRRTLPKAVSYFRAQRCGVAVPNYHPACHLDDARRRDNGKYVETTGGWHDAGDLRKWLHNTLYGGFGLMYLARNLGEKWDLAGSGLAPLLEEMRWGNRYFLKMQDTDGLVWSDVGGGINDDNSDNHCTGRWREAVRQHLDECVLPLCARSTYRIIPSGLYFGSPTAELYRPLAGDLTYRYFKPTGERLWASGSTSHLESYAVFLARAGKVFGTRAYTDLAYSQLEWVMGANPFAACLMTAEGMRNPYPHSRYVGLIPGGLPNGIAGDRRDEPVLDTQLGFDWRTVEYCTPHNAHYIWAISELEG
jgi:hypothetical protein